MSINNSNNRNSRIQWCNFKDKIQILIKLVNKRQVELLGLKLGFCMSD